MKTIICTACKGEGKIYSGTFNENNDDCFTCKGTGELVFANENEDVFDIQDIISFGYYARKNTESVMRKTFIDWKKQYKRLEFKNKT